MTATHCNVPRGVVGSRASTWLSKQNWIVISNTLLGYFTTRLTFQSQDSWAYDRPAHLALSCLVTLALLAHCSKQFIPHGDNHASREESSASKGSLRNVRFSRPALLSLGSRFLSENPGRAVLAFTLALTLRLVIFIQTTRHVACLSFPITLSSVTLLPLCLSLADFATPETKAGDVHGPLDLQPQMGANFHPRRSAIYGSLIYVIASAAMRIGSQGPGSTIICSDRARWALGLPLLLFEISAIFADVVIVKAISALLVSEPGKLRIPRRTAISYLGLSIGFVASLVLGFGLLWAVIVPEDRSWIFMIPFTFAHAVFTLNLSISVIAVTLVYLVSRVGLLMPVLNICTNVSFAQYFSSMSQLPPWDIHLALTGFCLLCSCSIHYSFSGWNQAQRLQPTRSGQQHKVYITVFFLFLLITGIALQVRRPGAIDQHPIDRLIRQAKSRHASWREQAYQSRTLSQAVLNYQRRYHLPPPPGFDKWYAFAITQNSSVIDDFDGMMRDLECFAYLEPEELRSRTWEALSNSDANDMTGLLIRGGRTFVHDVRDTHRWMLEGTQRMIMPFEKHIPDMDLAVNIDDEARVVTRLMQSTNGFRSRPASPSPPELEDLRPSFSDDRAATWPKPPPRPESDKMGAAFENSPFQNVFYSHGSPMCPDLRTSASKFPWDRSQVCASCMEGHSDTIFLSDWRASNDVCQQPDMQNLHGFYHSPATFKVTRKLLPIFSQAKTPQFNDILYPSPWNYMDKATYDASVDNPDPPFPNKNSSLFWRGVTTEGYSLLGGWTHFARQRFHQMLNSPRSPDAAVVLPSASGLRYTHLPASVLQSTLKPDVKFIAIDRCRDPDCEDQKAALGPLVRPTDFQHHWRYKYLLDLDGAGFSGRFLPFLRSRSLPFKAALFREWYDDRVEAWAHFVPLDLRGIGLWATLVYFAGFGDGVAGHQREAEDMAQAGRVLAGRVLRRQDMEVYMFRLLLEWGRLTDDKRDEIGFTLAEAKRVEKEWERADGRRWSE